MGGIRIVVVGANGAGKTHLALRLGQALDLPVIHNDALALQTGWQHRPRTEVAKARGDAISAPDWVLEGGPSILTPAVLARATVVIWLDPPRALRVWRIFVRSLRYFGQVRPEHPQGNVEWPGLRQLRFLAKAWSGDAVMRVAIVAGLEAAEVPVHHLRRRAAVSDLIKAAGEGAEGL